MKEGMKEGMKGEGEVTIVPQNFLTGMAKARKEVQVFRPPYYYYYLI
jgi:hypothetical protein